MGMLISFVVGVVAMAIFQRKQKVPIFRQEAADLAIKYLLGVYTKDDTPEERAANEPALINNFNRVIDAYSYMREHLK